MESLVFMFLRIISGEGGLRSVHDNLLEEAIIEEY